MTSLRADCTLRHPEKPVVCPYDARYGLPARLAIAPATSRNLLVFLDGRRPPGETVTHSIARRLWRTAGRWRQFPRGPKRVRSIDLQIRNSSRHSTAACAVAPVARALTCAMVRLSDACRGSGI